MTHDDAQKRLLLAAPFEPHHVAPVRSPNRAGLPSLRFVTRARSTITEAAAAWCSSMIPSEGLQPASAKVREGSNAAVRLFRSEGLLTALSGSASLRQRLPLTTRERSFVLGPSDGKVCP